MVTTDLLAPGHLVISTKPIMRFLRKLGLDFPYPPGDHETQEDFEDFFFDK